MQNRKQFFIPPNPPAVCRIIVAVVVVDEGQLGVIELAAPLDGLGGAASRRTSGALAWQAERGMR